MDTDTCSSCGHMLTVKTHMLENGDSVTFLRCENEGYYMVYDPRNDRVVRPEQKPCDHEPDIISTKLDCGDRVELTGCVIDGFYAVDWDGEEMLGG
jgi:hypothetical protein